MDHPKQRVHPAVAGRQRALRPGRRGRRGPRAVRHGDSRHQAGLRGTAGSGPHRPRGEARSLARERQRSARQAGSRHPHQIRAGSDPYVRTEPPPHDSLLRRGKNGVAEPAAHPRPARVEEAPASRTGATEALRWNGKRLRTGDEARRSAHPGADVRQRSHVAVGKRGEGAPQQWSDVHQRHARAAAEERAQGMAEGFRRTHARAEGT